jgi:transketolase
MRDAFIDELTAIAEANDRVVLMVGDLGFGVVDEFAKRFPKQFVNAGIAEQNMVGLAAGMASAGRKVFVYSIANFPTMRCLEQIRNDVCYHNLDVKIVSVGAGVAYGSHGYTHQAIEDLAVMRTLPHMRVVSPADPLEARLAAIDAAQRYGPAYIRLGKNGERVLHAEPHGIEISRPLIMRDGDDVIIAGTGAIVDECLKAAELLALQGIEARVLSIPLVTPMDTSWFKYDALTMPIFTVEEHVLTAGFGSVVLEQLSEFGISARVTRLGIQAHTLKELGSQAYLRGRNGIDANGIADRIFKFLGKITDGGR